MYDDLISRQAAIDALDKRFDSIPMEQTTEILLLRKDLRELPSAQPETNCSEIPNSSDTISRQAAIEAVKHAWAKGLEPSQYVEDLPSAQPEIIRCKDCKFWRTYTYVNGRPKFLPRCGFNQIYVNGEDFCSRAEKREK